MPADPLTATFAALADPTRRAILAGLAQPFAISAPAISKHLRVLERARLITRGRDRQSCRRHLTPGRIKEVPSREIFG